MLALQAEFNQNKPNAEKEMGSSNFDIGGTSNNSFKGRRTRSRRGSGGVDKAQGVSYVSVGKRVRVQAPPRSASLSSAGGTYGSAALRAGIGANGSQRPMTGQGPTPRSPHTSRKEVGHPQRVQSARASARQALGLGLEGEDIPLIRGQKPESWSRPGTSNNPVRPTASG